MKLVKTEILIFSCSLEGEGISLVPGTSARCKCSRGEAQTTVSLNCELCKSTRELYHLSNVQGAVVDKPPNSFLSHQSRSVGTNTIIYAVPLQHYRSFQVLHGLWCLDSKFHNDATGYFT